MNPLPDAYTHTHTRRQLQLTERCSQNLAPGKCHSSPHKKTAMQHAEVKQAPPKHEKAADLRSKLQKVLRVLGFWVARRTQRRVTYDFELELARSREHAFLARDSNFSRRFDVRFTYEADWGDFRDTLSRRDTRTEVNE